MSPPEPGETGFSPRSSPFGERWYGGNVGNPVDLDTGAGSKRTPAKSPGPNDAERARALELYAVVGCLEAAKVTGVPPVTLTQWAQKAGVVNPVIGERVRPREWEERRADLANAIGDTAEEALELARAALELGDARTAKDATLTMAICIDKAQLLTGGVTERHAVEDSFRERELEIAALRQQARLTTSQAAPQQALSPPPPEVPFEEGGQR